MIDVFHWFTLAVLWVAIGWTMRITRRRAIELRKMQAYEEEAKETFFLQSADATGLTPLQIQVALDASMAAFQQRIHEMQNSRG
jgi:Tfp pilus assembly protein PilO